MSLGCLTTSLPPSASNFLCVERITLKPALETYSNSLKSNTNSFTPSSISAIAAASSGAVTVSNLPSTERITLPI